DSLELSGSMAAVGAQTGLVDVLNLRSICATGRWRQIGGCPRSPAPDRPMTLLIQRFQVCGDREAIFPGQVAVVVVDYLSHGAAGEIAIRKHADIQKIFDVAQRPASNALFPVSRDVWDLLVAGPVGSPLQFVGVLKCAEAGAGGVAFATVAEV